MKSTDHCNSIFKMIVLYFLLQLKVKIKNEDSGLAFQVIYTKTL